MEISSNNVVAYGLAQQQAGRQATETPFEKEKAAAKGQETAVSPASSPQLARPSLPNPELDYRQLINLARQQAGNRERENAQQGEVVRIEEESLKVQQALGAYRDNAAIDDGEGELMPRLDSYV